MFCKKCGLRIDDDSVFCRSCGAKQHASETAAAAEDASSEMSSKTLPEADSGGNGEPEQVENGAAERGASAEKAAAAPVLRRNYGKGLISALMWCGALLFLAALAVSVTVVLPTFKASPNIQAASETESAESASVSGDEGAESAPDSSDEGAESAPDSSDEGAESVPDSSDEGAESAPDSSDESAESASGLSDEGAYTPDPGGYKAGTYAVFGKYPQQNDGAPLPIEWLVLENNGETALLLSKYGLDCRPFHNRTASVSWRDSDLRSWLNGDFLNTAFSAKEREHIAESVINTGDSPNGTKGCGETRDKVFCLSMEEAVQYFGGEAENKGDLDEMPNRARACEATEYAQKEGVWSGARMSEGEEYQWWFDNCNYWLRSPGSDSACIQFVGVKGSIFTPGVLVNNKYSAPDRGTTAVRPALRIKL